MRGMLAKAMEQQVNDDEVRQLFALAHEKSKAGRESLYAAVTDLFERRSDELQANERDMMIGILQHLSAEVEMSVRVNLANRLAARGDAPHDLIRMLASDDVQVAYKILAGSPVLRDADLIEVVRHRTMQHQLAVAIRKDVSEEVSAALVEFGSEDVIVTLLNNQDARISNNVLEYLAEESKRIDAYQKPLVRRPDLPDLLAERMYYWVSAAVRNYIVDNFDIDVDDLDDQMSAAVSDAIGESEDTDGAAAERLVDQLFNAGDLSAEFAMKSLRQGQISIFEFAFAKLIGIRPVLARRIIYEPGGEALGIACRAINLDRSAFLQIYHLTRKARDSEARLSKDEVVTLTKFFESVTQDSAFLVLRKWQRDRRYLNAVHELSS
ncbi:MAG: DUF2336 domain-containing protein [Alphaproteobacteria bacterium]|nr:DUF2336 domain-containing protein [Alphaproteobacteria bacterium]MDP6812382.1 DUF2336 domain-containing protein [Alphaproteobacteria bacterium]